MSRFCILMYHMIKEPDSVKEARYACPPTRFASHLRALKKAGYRTVTPRAIEKHLSGEEPLPDRSVLISIDDGFRDNYENAFPVLKQYQAPAVIFLATSHLGGHNDWMAGDEYPRRDMLTWEQVREMQTAGIHFGGHTMTHPRLSELTPEQALSEIAGCREQLEEKLGQSANWFAYPYGDLNDKTPALVKAAGFEFACSTRSGFNTPTADPLVLRRLEIYGTDPAWKVLLKLRFGANDVSFPSLARYYLGRIGARLRPGAH